MFLLSSPIQILAKPISNSKNFEIVFVFSHHPTLGLLIEANASHLLPNGSLSLKFEKIRQNNTTYYNLNAEQTEAVKIIELFEPAYICKKFYTGSRKISTPDFFAKHLNPELIKAIRKHIELQMPKLLTLIKNYRLLYIPDEQHVTPVPVSFTEEDASVLFHFRKNDEGMNYFATVKHSGSKVNIYQNNSELISAKPAWLLAENKLLHFPKSVDGLKLKPFLQKKYIHVESHQIDTYMNKFVKPLLENHDVYAVGFNIVTENHRASAILRNTAFGDDKNYLTLYFQYQNWSFPYHANKQVNVYIESTKDQYIFHRIKRNRNWEEEKVKILNEYNLQNIDGSLFSPHTICTEYDLVTWVNEHYDNLIRNGFAIEIDKTTIKYFVGSVSIDFSISQENDWFDVKAIARFGSFEIPFIRLRKYILEKKREYILPDNTVAILPEIWFERFNKIANLASEENENLKINKIHFSLLSDIVDYLDHPPQTPNWQSDFLLNTDNSIPNDCKFTLRSYQLEGYKWIQHLFNNNIGALLADDMGLGKTIQTLAVIAKLLDKNNQNSNKGLTITKEKTSNKIETNISGQLDLFSTLNSLKDENKNIVSQENTKPQCLVVAPKSLLYNWAAECAQFVPHLKILVHSGLKRAKLHKKFSNYDIIITSYGTMRKDIDMFREMQFLLVVLDESQAIKNPGSLNARSVVKLNTKYKMALSGTPLENTLLDIWSQMNFLNPGLLGTYSYFEKAFIKPIEKNNNAKIAGDLRKIIEPFILRRTKKEVVKELPEKVEKIHYCEMTPEQEKLYEETKSKYRNEILQQVSEVGVAKSKLKIFNGLLHLRQLALNPLLKNDEFEGSSGKDDEITFMLIRAIQSNHKVLVFSQFVSYLKIFEQKLKSENINYAYLDGSLDEKQRQEQIQLFQNNIDVKVFLLSLKAGNSGLNLTAADYVFLCDPWWNPFTMKQAEDRAHRIGQEKTVFSYKFITKNTIEEKILKLQQKKSNLAESIIPDENAIINQLNDTELQELFA